MCKLRHHLANFSIFGSEFLIISGFSANRVVPPFQPVIPNPQISSLAPVISNARSTSLSLAEGTDETQTTVVVEKTQTVSNVVPVMNFQQANETAVSIKKQESV